MKFLSYTVDDAPAFGLVSADGQGVIELGSSERQRIEGVTNLGQLVGEGRLDDARVFVDETADHALDDICYERLLPWPEKIFCCLLYTSPSPRDQRGSRMPSSA